MLTINAASWKNKLATAFSYHQVCWYLIVGIDKEIYGFPKSRKTSCLYNIHCKNLRNNKIETIRYHSWTYIQNQYRCITNYVIKFKKNTTTFLSADLTALWPTVRLLAVGVWTIISHNDAGDCCLITIMKYFVLSAIACLLILHSTNCDVELVTANQQMPAGISHKNIFFETQDESPQT